MAAPTTTGPIMQALVQTLRGNTALKAALTGGIHEGIAPEDSKYPWLIYSLHFGTMEYSWGGLTLEPGFDIFIFHRDQVEARNLDQLVMNTLHDAALAVTGQTSLYCRRTMEMSLTDVDEEGKKVYQVGGIWEIWSDQTL